MSKMDAFSLFANLPFILISLVVLGVVAITVGGLKYQMVIGTLLNPWIWAAGFFMAALLEAVMVRPDNRRTLVFGVFIGLMFWAVMSYAPLQSQSSFCGIPLIGGAVCLIQSSLDFVGSVLNFLIDVLVSVTVFFFIEYFVSLAVYRGRRRS